MKQSHKTLLLWVMLIMIFALIWKFMPRDQPKPVAFSEFVSDVAAGHVESVVIHPNRSSNKYVYKYKDEGKEQERAAYGLSGTKVDDQLLKADIPTRVEPEDQNAFWTSILATWVPMILLLGLFFFFMRQLQNSGGKAMSFGKSRARLLNETQNRVTFADVAGIDEAKDDCEEIIAFLKEPKKFQRLGGRIPKGVLLMGAPGTGKTLLARAIAGEAGVPFFSISGSDFVEMFVGVGASRVRDLFEQGKKHAPCIIFIDEIDAVGRHRGSGLGGGHDEREQTLNQLLVEMDGFESTDGVIIIAATNRPDVLDPAILRPGRFDRRIMVPRPDLTGRLGILGVHTRKVPLEADVDLDVIARGSPGFSGADLENLVNEAALNAARCNRDRVTHDDFDHARDKVMMGAERKSMRISAAEKKTTAWHEAGHTLVAALLPEGTVDPIHKVTIIPRGRALGVTHFLPEQDKLSYDQKNAEGMIAVSLGGRIAEELEFEGLKSTGAGNDLHKCSEIARKMVCEWGMSDRLGPITFGKEDSEPFLGRDINRQANYSEATAQAIDDEVHRIITSQYQRARRLLEDNYEALRRIALALIEREVLTADEVRDLVADRSLPPLEQRKPVTNRPDETPKGSHRPAASSSAGAPTGFPLPDAG